MPIDLAAVGRACEPFTREWDGDDALLYALSVGAGSSDPASELQFTTENSGATAQAVLPTLAVPLIQTNLGKRLPFGDYPRGALVHAEQVLAVHGPLPVAGSMTVTARIAAITDKGSGALVHIDADAHDTGTGTPLVSTRLGYFVRGEGGFGGPALPKSRDAAETDGAPDASLVVPTRPEQALLYRLNGDRNPLHSDPEFARAAGFPRPILHGLGTYGMVARAFVTHLFQGDPQRLKYIAARFTKPVFPGDELTIDVWRRGDQSASFRVTSSSGVTVLERGRLAGEMSMEQSAKQLREHEKTGSAGHG